MHKTNALIQVNGRLIAACFWTVCHSEHFAAVQKISKHAQSKETITKSVRQYHTKRVMWKNLQ